MIKSIKWMLVFGILALFSLGALSESVEEAQIKLLRLEKKSLTQSTALNELISQKTEQVQKRNEARSELTEKETELAKLSEKMQAAIARQFSDPSAENEREANNLSRSFTLAEITVRTQKLEVERVERKYNEILREIETIKSERVSTRRAIELQSDRVKQLKIREVAKTRTSSAERPEPKPMEKPVEPRPVKPETIRPEIQPAIQPAPALAEPRVVEPETDAPKTKTADPRIAEPEPGANKAPPAGETREALSIEEQLENIDRHVNENADW